MKSCKTCRHMSKLDTDNYFCRRYPPTIVKSLDDGSQTVAFPTTRDTWSCGEHDRRWWPFGRRA